MATQTRSRNGTHVLAGGNSFSISADTSELEAYLDAMGAAAQDAVRPAAQAGIQILYDAIQVNVSAMGRVTGNLGTSIYQYYSQENSVEGVSAEYHASWNHKKAPHGHLLEFGWMQRYEIRLNKKGEWITLIRPEAIGKPKPRRRASQAEKDAYYVPRQGGPKWNPGRWFTTRAADQMERALAAADQELQSRLDKVS